MNKKVILSGLLICLGLAVFVSAKMTPNSPDGYNHNVEVYLEKGWNLVLVAPILGVHAGDTYADDTISSDSQVKRENIKAVYYYDRGRYKYIQIYPNSEEFQEYIRTSLPEDKAYMMFSSAWVYSDKEGLLKYSRVDVPKYTDVVLENGWNFLTVTPEMKGLKFDDIKGGCNIEKVCFYKKQNWDCGSGAEIGQHTVEDTDSNVGFGMVIKVTDDCGLGSRVPRVPALP